MKNLFKSLMLVAVAAMAFVGCTEDTNEEKKAQSNVQAKTVITIDANFYEDTRAALGAYDNGTYPVLWEANDQVIFKGKSTGGNDVYAIAYNPELKNGGKSASFTATFNEELAEGSTITAYLYGYYRCDSYNDWYTGALVYSFYTQSLNYQYPTTAAPEYIVASAEFEYTGEKANVEFTHDMAYGKFQLGGDLVVSGNVTLEVRNSDGGNTYQLSAYDCDGKTFWFACEPMADVTTFVVDFYATDYKQYRKEVDMTDVSKPLTFTAGRISSFGVDNLNTYIDAPSNFTATPDKTSIVFDWDDVANATGYDVKVTYLENWNQQVAFEGSVEESTYTATELKPLTEYTIEVVATTTTEGYCNSNKGSYSASTLADMSALDAEFTDVVEFAAMTKVAGYSNTYLFTTEGGGNTKSDDFMYLSFYNDITTQDGEYGISDLNYGYCYCWLASNPMGWGEYSGYSDAYGLGFNPYHVYPNSGDTYLVYVDVDENTGNLTLTAYLNNASWWGDVKFKGCFTGTVTE